MQYVATPLSGDITDNVRSRYAYLRKYGPNDGLTLLADELMPDGITIIEPGVDHFYRDPEIDLKSLAIANLVAEELTAGWTIKRVSSGPWLPLAPRRILQDIFTPHPSLNWKKTR